MTISSDIAVSPYAILSSWEHLLWAYRRAAKAKRGMRPAAQFEFRLADQLIGLQRELRDFTYRPGAYVHFKVHEPKHRLISAAPFRDRVVHHALCQIIEPGLDRRFISESYANRRSKGTHAAVDKLQDYAHRYAYVLRADIVKHFPSIDHAILLEELGKVIHDPDVMWLIEQILASGARVLRDEYEMVYFPGDDLFAIHRPRGLPIGNLTSQFWSNCYLNPFDWFIKRELRCPAYLRYVDDFALFSNDKAQLWEWKAAIQERLARLRLTIHEREAQVLPCKDGIPWLGFVVYPDHRRLKRRKVVHFTRHFRQLIENYAAGHIPFAELDAAVQGWINHVRYADTWGLRTHLFNRYTVPFPPKKHPEEGDFKKIFRLRRG